MRAILNYVEVLAAVAGVQLLSVEVKIIWHSYDAPIRKHIFEAARQLRFF